MLFFFKYTNVYDIHNLLRFSVTVVYRQLRLFKMLDRGLELNLYPILDSK